MKKTVHCIGGVFFILLTISSHAQINTIIKAPAEKRLPLFWKYCTEANLSDRDSVTVHAFFTEIIQKADSARDTQLKIYARYFQKCWRIFFSERYEKNFPAGQYQPVIDIFSNTQSWAEKNGYDDIVASCEHSIGAAYYRAYRYGQAFEHLLKADDAFEKIGYHKVPNASFYLYDLGLCFYRFEEYDKALQKFLEAAQYQFYVPRNEVNNYNTIGLIYAQKNDPQKAISFFRQTMAKAKQHNDPAWIGISSGNIGNVLISEGQYDSALFYHRKSYQINSNLQTKAPEDAAKSALSIAAIFLQKGVLDSATYYVHSGEQLGTQYIIDTAERLDFHRRLLKVLINYSKLNGDFRNALLLTDSLALTEKELTSMLDSKILSRAIEKTETTSYTNRLQLLKSQKDLAQLRSYLVIAILLTVIVLIGLLFRDKWFRKKRQIQLAEKDKQILLAEKLRAEDRLKHAEELLKTQIDTIRDKSVLIENLESELIDLRKMTLHTPELMTLTSRKEKLMASTILTDQEWQHFKILFEQVYPGFSYRLKANYPELSPAEARFFYLTKLNFSSREMATMLGISIETIHKLRYRLRKKLNLEEADSFDTLVQNIS